MKRTLAPRGQAPAPGRGLITSSSAAGTLTGPASSPSPLIQSRRQYFVYVLPPCPVPFIFRGGGHLLS